MLSQMEDVDILDRMVMVRWVVLLRSMEAWTIQLFICLTSKGPANVERADGAPFSICSGKLHAQTRTDNIPLLWQALCQKSWSCLGCNLWPVSLLIFMWPCQNQIKYMLVKFHKSLRVLVAFVLRHKTSVLKPVPVTSLLNNVLSLLSHLHPLKLNP